MRFFYHYNKPKTQKTGETTITLHYLGHCHFIHGLKIMVPTYSKINKRQPHFVMCGEANKIEINNDYALIT